MFPIERGKIFQFQFSSMEVTTELLLVEVLYLLLRACSMGGTRALNAVARPREFFLAMRDMGDTIMLGLVGGGVL